MNEINGVHPSSLNQTKLEDTLKLEKEETETGIFEGIAEEMEESAEGVLSNIDDALLAEKIKKAAPELLKDNKGGLIADDEAIAQEIRDIVQDYKNFDVEEAHVYAEGEAAIKKEVEMRVKMQMVQTGIALKHKSAEEIEAEVRAKYAEEHPEYAAVMHEGQRVEAQYEEAKAEEMSNWEKENPKPKRSKVGFIFGGVLSEVKYQLELKEWEKAKAEHEKSFQNDYAKENKNYANLKEQQEAQEPKKKLHLTANVLGAGGGWLGGLLAGGPFGGIVGGVAGAFGSEKLADYKDSKEI